MENLSIASAGEDFVDVASMRFLDLRTLGQDEIQCLAHLCTDVPARLQDLVNVIVDKSIFNESAGSRRQTFDRERVPRNKDRRLSGGSASAQLHLALEGAGLSHRDLILHICRQLHISEKGDKALYQAQMAQSAGVVVEGNRPMSLKRMARASFTGRADAASELASGDAAANGKGMPVEVLHRSSKKMKTKEEARRRAAEAQAGAIVPVASELVTVKIISSGHEGRVVLKNMPKRAVATAGRINSSDLAQNDLNSPEKQIAQSIIAEADLLNLGHESVLGKSIKLRCATCSGTFVNTYTLRRHVLSTGHSLDENLFVKAVARKKKKRAPPKSSLRCSCGNTYATPYTLRRHVITNGHTVIMETLPTTDTPLQPGDNDTSAKGLKPGKGKLQTYLSKRLWNNKIRHFKCSHCHRQFIKKKHYVRHLDSHFSKKKKLGRQVSRLLGSGDEVRVDRIGRPPKLDAAVHDKLEKVKKQKRKHEPELLDKRVRFRKEEESSQQTPASISSRKFANVTCQECGKKFKEYARYTGHLSVHARLRKALVGEMNTSTRKLELGEVQELSALGYRKLLNGVTGTYMSSSPAKYLFPKPDPVINQKRAA